MKIALIDMANLKYMPYVKSYLNVIDCSRTEVCIIHWKREAIDSTELDPRVHIHSYEKMIVSSMGLKYKLKEIIKYRSFLRKKIKEISPDFLVVHYQTTALLVYDLLTGKFRNKYILDYRDITYEKKPLFRKLVARMVEKSACTFISSEGFKKYLPESGKIHISHNVDLNQMFNTDLLKTKSVRGTNPVRIACWGRIRNDKTNNRFIDAVSKAHDVELHYYGTMCDSMREKIQESVNVFYHGQYSTAERFEFAKDTDMLLNSYDKDDKNMPFATSNKFYDGVFFYIPQICSQDSVMGEKCVRYGIGTKVCTDEPDFLEKILGYYRNLDKDAFIHNCEAAKAVIENDMDAFAGLVREAVYGENK